MSNNRIRRRCYEAAMAASEADDPAIWARYFLESLCGELDRREDEDEMLLDVSLAIQNRLETGEW